MIVLMDTARKANIIYLSLTKCKRVMRSVLATEPYRIAYSFNIAAAIKSTINKILSIIIPLILCTDLKLLFNYLVRLSITQKKHLIINIICYLITAPVIPTRAYAFGTLSVCLRVWCTNHPLTRLVHS